jgi:hypothetical protein
MVIIHKPCLATVPIIGTSEEPGLADILPENCYVQEIIIECCRSTRSDRPVSWVGSDYFTIRESAPGTYIGRQTISLTTPIQKPPGSHNWEGLVQMLREADQISADRNDVPIASRTLTKGCVLVEIPKEVWHPPPFQPQKAFFDPYDPDPLYEGNRIIAVHIEGTRFMSEALMVKDGWLPGGTHKPLDIVQVDFLTTKPLGRDMARKAEWMAFSRKEEDIITIPGERLSNLSDAELYNIFPSLCDAGVIQLREQDVAEYALSRDKVIDVGLRRIQP